MKNEYIPDSNRDRMEQISSEIDRDGYSQDNVNGQTYTRGEDGEIRVEGGWQSSLEQSAFDWTSDSKKE